MNLNPNPTLTYERFSRVWRPVSNPNPTLTNKRFCRFFFIIGRFYRVPAFLYPNLFVTRRFVPAAFKRDRVRYLGLGLGFVLVLGLRVSGRATD